MVKGYPEGLAGKEIPESARICAIADVFDALTMIRPYKPAWTVEDAFDEIEKGMGTHFDPEIAKVFLSLKEEILAIKNEWADQDDTSDLYYDVEDFVSIL